MPNCFHSQELPILEVRKLVVEFERRLPVQKNFFFSRKAEKFRALDSVSFTISRGKTLGLVGESGCGKSTLARAIMRLQPIHSGEILYAGESLSNYPRQLPLSLRRKVQMVFQNPYASLNPRQTIESILAEPLEIHFPEMDVPAKRSRIQELLEQVAIPCSALQRFPHEFSGGQRQRIAIARALASRAELIVCDEPVSALDVSVQAQIIKLLCEIQKQTGISYLFVAHDLALVEQISDEVLVMNRGKIIERGKPIEVYSNPRDSYTRRLLDSVPRLSE